uniref:Fork-head domain-containing protein n=1 Tax=Monopterus albus TaxID=43700 RepID=A0A3Q3K6Z4_MONAL
MQNPTEKSGDQLYQRGLMGKSTTYLAKIAFVLQNAPGKMLTFTQLMDELAPLICEDRKSVENNIRVCLSTSKCFAKIPVIPDSVASKKNYWKLDCSQITEKMLRRHFKGILHFFPELASRVEMKNTSRAVEHCSALCSPEPAVCRAVQIKCKVKFTSPFSIESLLKKDAPHAQTSRVSPLSSMQQPWPTHGGVGTKRSFSWDHEKPLLLQASGGSSPICSTGGSTHHGLTAAAAAESFQTMHVCTEPSFPVYTTARAASHFISPNNSYITHSAPAVSHDAFRFWL